MKRSGFNLKRGCSRGAAFRNKYGAVRYYSNLIGRGFDSTGEGRYGEHLFSRQKNGEIDDLAFQVTVQLSIGRVKLSRLRVDFRYHELRWCGQAVDRMVWDEFKGFPTDDWLVKKREWAAGGGPGLLRVTRAGGSRIEPYRFEELWPACAS